MPLASLLKNLPRASCYWVAFSGGLDSTVLLHALVGTKPSVPVRAVHVNHGLSSRADAWQAQCETVCRALGVPLESVRVEVRPSGKGLEDAAREARYRVFEQLLKPDNLLLTAHHGDDQAETMLLRLMRGAGPRGLAGMAKGRSLGAGSLRRPLLGVARAELEAYATAEGLRWVNDESNSDEHFDRNFLRHQVLPPLRRRWPGLVSAWGESAVLCAESETLLAELARGDLERVVCVAAGERPAVGAVLDIEALRALSLPRRHNLLRYWVRAQGLPVSGRALWAQVDEQLIDGREDARARVVWNGLELRRFRQGLYLLRSEWLWEPSEKGISIPIDPDRQPRLALPDGGELSFERVSRGAAPEVLQPGLPDLQIRWRRGGERCQPAQRAHSQTLKKLLQEHDLEPWWRPQLPLIYSGDTLVAVGDLWICRGFETAPEQAGYRLVWRLPGSF